MINVSSHTRQCNEHSTDIKSRFALEHVRFSQYRRPILGLERYYPESEDQEPWYGMHIPTDKSVGTMLTLVQSQLHKLLPNNHEKPPTENTICIFTENGAAKDIPLAPVLQNSDLPNFINARLGKMGQKYDFEPPPGRILWVDAYTDVGRFAASDMTGWNDKELAVLSDVNLTPQIIEAYEALTPERRMKWVDMEGLREAVASKLWKYASPAQALASAKGTKVSTQD